MSKQQIIVPAEHVEAFRIEVERELGYAADALASRVRDGFGSMEYAQERLRAAELLYAQAHEQDAPLVIDVSEALCGTLPFVIEYEADELRSDVQAAASPEAHAQMRRRVDAIAFWMGVIESLGDRMYDYGRRCRERQGAEAVELKGEVAR